jgi:hypothetical protein
LRRVAIGETGLSNDANQEKTPRRMASWEFDGGGRFLNISTRTFVD